MEDNNSADQVNPGSGQDGIEIPKPEDYPTGKNAEKKTEASPKNEPNTLGVIRAAEHRMIWLTAAMAFFALCGVVVGILQWISSSGQKSTMDQTLETMVIQTKAMQGQLEQMKAGSSQTDKLIASGKISADAARKSADSASTSVGYIKTTQRAAVYFRGLRIPEPRQTGESGWAFRVTWENGGDTIARKGRVSIDSCFGPGDLISCFSGGNATPDFMLHERVTRPFSLPPKGELISSAIYVSDGLLAAVRKRLTHLYIWGTATYEDVFEVTHITRFCGESVPVEAPGAPLQWTGAECEANDIPIHSCTDEECSEEPQYPGDTSYRQTKNRPPFTP